VRQGHEQKSTGLIRQIISDIKSVSSEKRNACRQVIAVVLLHQDHVRVNRVFTPSAKSQIFFLTLQVIMTSKNSRKASPFSQKLVHFVWEKQCFESQIVRSKARKGKISHIFS
jgi:hypothetical protein